MAVPLPNTGAHVWYRLTATVDATALDEATALLSEAERARCARFVMAADRRDFTMAHALLRRTLSRYHDVAPRAWTFTTNPFGKPSIAAGDLPPLRFNLAHTNGLVACAVAAPQDGLDLGIDAEAVDRAGAGIEIAERFFAPAETAALAACDATVRAARFVELWTLKEAYIKAIGSGLTHALNAFAFALEGAHGVRLEPSPDVDPSAWCVALFAPSAAHRMAVAIHADRIADQDCAIVTWDEAAGTETSCLLRGRR